MNQTSTVAIIGAGACGLVCAKVLLDDGFDVTLFEQQREIGGIWSSQSAYAGLHSQQPGGTMEFSHLYSGLEFASWENIHDYLQKYADLFDISKRIRFQTRVISVRKDDLKDADLLWTIETETSNGDKQTNQFHFVVVASGLFSKAFVPKYPGEKNFLGSIVAPSDIKSTKQLENKRVIVVGGGKCATDMSVLAARFGQSCYLVLRKAHWMIPKKIFAGLIPVRFLFTRVLSVVFSPMPNAPHSYLFRFAHRKFEKFFEKQTDLIGADVMSIHGPDLANDQIFIPHHPFKNSENISVIPDDFLRMKREGRLIGKLGQIEQILDGTTVRLDSGEELQADLIISATGFIRSFPFLSPEDAQVMGLTTVGEEVQLNLYRRAIPTGVPNVAFVGFTGSLGLWMTAEVASHWISDYFLKRLQLPNPKEMSEEIETSQDFLLKIFNRNPFDYRYYWIPPIENYLQDMGLNLHRTNNWLSEYFGIYRPDRLRSLHHERSRVIDQFNMNQTSTVAIIGAGACGLVCAKVLLDDGFDVTLFEQQREIGGIWSPQSAYAGLHSQQPGGTMEFSHLYSGLEFASWENIHDYLQNYADLFDISKRIRFQTRVQSIRKDHLKDSNIPWIIQTETIDGEKQINEFDFVVIATGLYSQPYLPTYPGEKDFLGSIVAPSDIKSTKQLENKRVIVVGGGKCALDMSVLAARYAQSCYLVFRKAHWMMPKKIVAGLLPLRIFFTRALAAIFPPMHRSPHGALFRFVHRNFEKLFDKIFDMIGADVLSTHGPDLINDRIFIPQYRFKNSQTISVIPDDFLDMKRQGRLIGKLGQIEQILDGTTVRLDSGEELQADLIISATGFVRSFSFFSSEDVQAMGFTTVDEDVQLNLYRRVIPVDVPNIAFVGFTGTLSNWMTAEVASHWISDYFLKRLQLPNSKEMSKEIQTNEIFLLKTFNRNPCEYRYYWITPFENYLHDMGLHLHRTNNWLSEYFGIYRPDRLRNLHEERRYLAETGHRPRHFYFSFTMNCLLILFLLFIYRFFSK